MRSQPKLIEGQGDGSHNCVVFSLKNQVGGLARALKVFQDNGVNVIHIESRKSKKRPSEYEIMLDVDCDNVLMDEIMKTLSQEVAAINLSSFEQGQRFPRPLQSLQSMSSFGKSENTIVPRLALPIVPILKCLCDLTLPQISETCRGFHGRFRTSIKVRGYLCTDQIWTLTIR